MLKNTLTILSLLLGINSFAQKLDHVQGELIIQIHQQTNVNRLLKTYKTFKNKRTKIKPNKCLSNALNIWQINFDFTIIHESQIITQFRKDPSVLNAQFNHFISLRNTPNDSSFNQQWQYINDGSLGGNPNADIDADLAWDITTGGTTINGDTIVVCALDNGVNLNHEDIIENLWRNHGEIPDNDIDDDGNGYIDDVNGWNAVANTGNITFGELIHGTPVMGIMGAKGNNQKGVTGISWDVKLMMVKMDFQADEATLIAAYGYPLAMRKMYNDTNGEKGAFVVATNASWGLNNGMPDDAPIWCALYDSLGTVGILNCGATINSNVNVDIDGDLPTTCPSEYLISVTNLNRTGGKEFFAGYGKEHIDLGAFGEDTYTVGREGYESFNGTSAATPHVTGAIGLLYAAPCKNFGDLIKSNPAEVALLVRQFILDGVKPNEFIDTITATGGQLNLNNSLELLMQTCGACPPPLTVSTSQIIDVSANINWISSGQSDNTIIRYRIQGTINWTEVTNIAPPYTLTNLQACSNYEYQLKNNCGMETSDFGRTFTFKTDACCIPPENVRLVNTTTNSVRIEWDSLLAAENYEVHFNVLGTGNLQIIATTETFIEFDNLEMCTGYEFQVRTVCKDEAITGFSPLMTVTTNGCGTCTDAIYCESRAELQDEWISKVTFNTIENESGDDLGYGDFTGISTDINTLATYDLTINISYQGFSFDENIQAWIDFNQDGIFDEETENVINLEEDVSNEYIGQITIPVDAEPGLTRMRISLKWREGNDPSKPRPCDIFDFGEIEDYCVNIIQTVGSCFVPADIALLDNPIDDIAFLTWQDAVGALNYNYLYRIIDNNDWIEANTDNLSTVLLSELTRCATYEFQAQSLCDSMKVSDYSASFMFNTQCDCSPPINIQQVDTNLTAINLTWEAIEMADKYEVNLNRVGETMISRIVTTNNSASYSSLEKCSEYEVKIRGFCLDTDGIFSATFPVFTACDVAIKTLPIEVEALTVFPNPFRDNLSVEIHLKKPTKIACQLLSISGKLMFHKELDYQTAGQQFINFEVNDLPQGVYLLGIETEKGRTVRRVVKM